MKKNNRYITPQLEVIENWLEHNLMAGSNQLNDMASEIEFYFDTMDEGNGSDAAARSFDFEV
ncbi:MAG: hypothetical protein IKR31_02985 [Prevotella sp.]|jgi:hypothetical protein|nr:hypothetical protein [Prevotella sp.]